MWPASVISVGHMNSGIGDEEGREGERAEGTEEAARTEEKDCPRCFI